MSRDILSVFDNLQRALDLADDILDEKSLPMIEGLELTKKDLLEVFKRNKGCSDYFVWDISFSIRL